MDLCLVPVRRPKQILLDWVKLKVGISFSALLFLLVISLGLFNIIVRELAGKTGAVAL
jgi:hypothetical protein